MLMSDIIQRFRDENPELDQSVISDATLQAWLLIGDSEVCTKCRLINYQGAVINPVIGQMSYDLTAIIGLPSTFLDIDEMPGGGVVAYYNDTTTYKRLEKQTKAWLDNNTSAWRTAGTGKPLYYYRYGQYLNIYPTPDSTVTKITIDCVILSNPFNNLNLSPYNQLPYLYNFHYALVLYLTWRAKVKIGKTDESDVAFKLYDMYVQWMIKTIGGGKYGPIEFRPSGLPYRGYQR